MPTRPLSPSSWPKHIEFRGPSPNAPPVDPEYIPSDYGFQRYFTRAQCRLYINSIFIDEFQSIHWDLSYNLIPKFGYCSSKFDDVANGKSLVQGQLLINFVSPGYLIGALISQLAAAGSTSSTSSAVLIVFS